MLHGKHTMSDKEMKKMMGKGSSKKKRAGKARGKRK